MTRYCGWFMVFGVLLTAPFTVYATALDDYVAIPDPAYTFTVNNIIDGDGYTAYIIRMTSQTWRTSSEVNRTVWQHWLTIGVPDVVTNDTGMLAIGGGSNTSSPSDMEPYLGMVITATGSILGYLEQVPNEPLRFSDESFSRTEDAIIAYSFDKFMLTGDPTWPVLLPMVKSVMRALDTMTTIAATHSVTLNKYVIGGGSKRGWTTYLAAAVDPRVVAMAPIVFDASNMSPSMVHHYQCYGAYSSAIHDYNDLNIFQRMDTPEGAALRAIVDPYSYFDRYTMPKLCVTATGDEFFVLDSSQFYFKDLPGEKFYRTVPNSGHGIETDMTSIGSLFQYYLSIATNQPRPEFSWTFEDDGSIRVNTVTAPSRVYLWQAANPSTRDFRWYGGSGPAWTKSTLTEEFKGSGVYVANVPTPASGWAAFYIEIAFPDGTDFSTEIRVTPSWLPYGDIDNDGIINLNDDDMDDDGIPNGDDLCAWDHTPWIDPPVGELETMEDMPFEYVLTPHENDLENTGALLTWAASAYPPSLFSVDVDSTTDTLTLSPVPDAFGAGSFTLTLSDPKGQTASQLVSVNILPVEEEGEGTGEGALEEGQPEGVLEGQMEGAIEGVLEGALEGATEGLAEGSLEGLMEGYPEGIFEGEDEGPSEGLPEGMEEGLPEGMEEGLPEGTEEGLPEGMEEGMAEGEAEGTGEGMAEGEAEGTGEGMEEGQTEGVVEGEGMPTEGALEEGQTEGLQEGISEGEPEGLTEGLLEGAEEGLEEGVLEGSLEGTEEGLAEGMPEGIMEGALEGAPEGTAEGATEGEGIEDGLHSADLDNDHQIHLSELLRIIQFFNSDGYHCQAGTEDGFAPGSGTQTCIPHNSDYNPQDWYIDLSELLRLVQFFNSGGYHYCPEETTEDGFCPGP